MKSPQIENGYTRIANELLEGLMSYRCSSLEMAVILCVIRRSYGFGRKETEIGVAYITKAVMRDRRKVAAAVASLISKDVLTEVVPASYGKSRILKLNKDFDQWQRVCPKQDTVFQTGHRGMSQTVHPPTSLMGHHINKERNTKDILRASADEIYEHYKTAVKPGASADAKKSIVNLLRSGFTKEQLTTSINQYSGNGMSPDKKYRIQANNFFGRAERFRDYLSEEPKEVIEQDIPQHLALELVARGFEPKDKFKWISGTELVHYTGRKDCLAECRKLGLIRKAGEA